MTDVSTSGAGAGSLDDLAGGPARDDPNVELLGAASAGLGVLGFFTLLRVSDRRGRTSARTFGLWLTASAESHGAVILGALAVRRSRAAGVPTRGFLLAATGLVLGSLSVALNLNWLRTRRRD